MDAARLMPWLGMMLFFLPLLWRDAATSTGLLYLFLAWIVLIGGSWALSRRLDRTTVPDKDADEPTAEG